jgi:hypothetical protein
MMKATQPAADNLEVTQVPCLEHEPVALERSDELAIHCVPVDQIEPALQCQCAAATTGKRSSSDFPSPCSPISVSSTFRKRACTPLYVSGAPYSTPETPHSALECEQLLDTVFSYVGPGEYFYAAGVCKQWKERYAQLCFAHTECSPHFLRTSYASALRTAERLSLALKCSSGLTVAALQGHSLLARDIVQSSAQPEEVLALGAAHGLVWTSELCLQAVQCSKLSLLQRLRALGCPWDAAAAAGCAARSASVEVLQYVLQSAAAWISAQLTDLLRQAGTWNSLAAVQWLRGQGAAWPKCFRGAALCGRVDVFHCSPRVTDWILANGCDWGEDWCCETIASKRYESERVQQRAAQLFALAHAHGCPCTCGTPAPLEKKRR